MLLTFFPYASTRISTWRDPFSSSLGRGVPDSPVAVHDRLRATFSGLGLGGSRRSSCTCLREHNDFIFSVTCEELGFIGAAFILILFPMLILRGY